MAELSISRLYQLGALKFCWFNKRSELTGTQVCLDSSEHLLTWLGRRLIVAQAF